MRNPTTVRPFAGLTERDHREVTAYLSRWWSYRGPHPYEHRRRWHGRRPKRRAR